MVAWLVGKLVGWWVGLLVGWLAGFVEHQKLNQTTPGVVWLSFWYSTYSGLA